MIDLRRHRAIVENFEQKYSRIRNPQEKAEIAKDGFESLK